MDEWIPENYRPRAPTPQENKDVHEAARRYWGLTQEEMPGQGYVAIFDHYITGCPGWAGRTALILWDGSPSYVDTAIFKDGKWELIDRDDETPKRVQKVDNLAATCDGDCNCPDCLA